MDIAMSERDAVSTEPLERSSHRFTLFMVYALFAANAFLPVFAVTVVALTYIVCYLFLSGLSIPKDIWRYLAIPVVLICIGLTGSLGNDRYDAMKDVWHFANSAIVLLAGYLAMKRVGDMERLLRVLVVGGFILAIYHLVNIAADPALLFDASVGAFRQEYGSGYLLAFISLSIMIFSNRYGLRLFTSRHKSFFVPVMILVTAASLALSLSRTMWGSFLIIVFVMLGLFTLRRARIFIVVVLLLAALMTLNMVTSGGGSPSGTMLGKLSNSVDEVMLRDYTRAGDIALHWRGYESYRAMQTYLDGGWLNLAAGHGLGKLVDLNMYTLLGGQEFRFIPVMHNGYMYVLVKTGAIGLALYLWYLYLFYRDGSAIALSEESKDVFAGRMIVALSLVLVFTTFVVAGYFNKSAMVSAMFLLGTLLCYARARKIKGVGI